MDRHRLVSVKVGGLPGYAGSAVGASGLAKGPRLKPPESLPCFMGLKGPCSLRFGIEHCRRCFRTRKNWLPSPPSI